MKKLKFFIIICYLISLSACSVNKSKKEAISSRFMIASQGNFSTMAGVEMFEQGGNVFDAFAAISFTISVERPQSTGLGGGGFLTYYKKGMDKPSTVDFREQAPLKGVATMFQDKQGNIIAGKSLDGIFAVGVPGLVAGVVEIHSRFGKLPLKTVLAPAIKLAKEGFSVSQELAWALNERKKVLGMFPATRKIFFKDGRPLNKGDVLRQEDLAKTLQLISRHGKKGFYEGEVADAIASEMKRQNGLISKKDLLGYRVKERAAVRGTYKDYTIYSMGPPSSGGIHVIQILNILENSLEQMKWDSFERVHLTASAMQLSFADRAFHLGDADFVKVPVEGLVSKEYAKALHKKIVNIVSPAKEISAGNPWKYQKKETTHFTVMDREGNTISSTQTINGLFGSAVVVPGTGIILNNEMDDFTAKVGALNLFGAVGGEKNAISPKKRPLSSMSPTIVFKDGKPVLALGAPGGTRILTCVTQVLLNFMQYKMPLDKAVSSPRIHQQWKPDRLEIEKLFHLRDELKSRGHILKEQKSLCKVQAVARVGDKLHGVSDPRYDGMSFGK